MSDEYLIRPATLADAATIIAQRRAMFYDMGHQDDSVLDAMSAHFAPWLDRKMRADEYLAWFAVDSNNNEIVAGLGLWLMDWPPHLVGPGTARANILNVYTRPDARRRGLARRLVDVSLAWCRERGIRTVILHASPAGRPIYEAMGFQSTNEMRIVLPGSDQR